jgi:hypothetical protein
MDLPEYLQGLSFRFVQPEQPPSLTARAATAALARLRAPLDAWNTRLPLDRLQMRRRLRSTRVGRAPRPLAVRAILNRGVTQLAEREAFVAFGLGEGDPLLAAIAGNREKLCVGVPESDSPRHGDAFLRRFGELANGERHFIEPSFTACVARLEERDIGLCFLSAASHEPIAGRLALCEPHLAENAYVLLDNCNCERTRLAALDFMQVSGNQYRVLVDARTSESGPLTFGRGLLVMQLLGRNTAARLRSQPATPPVLAPAA